MLYCFCAFFYFDEVAGHCTISRVDKATAFAKAQRYFNRPLR